MAKRKVKAAKKKIAKRIAKIKRIRKMRLPALPSIKPIEKRDRLSQLISIVFVIFVLVVVLMVSGFMTMGVRNFAHAQNIFASSQVVEDAWLQYRCLVPLQDSVSQIFYIDKDNDYKISSYQGPRYVYKSVFLPCDKSLAINIDYSLRGGSSFIPMDAPIPDTVKKYYLVVAICSDAGTYADATIKESVIYAVIDAKTGKVY